MNKITFKYVSGWYDLENALEKDKIREFRWGSSNCVLEVDSNLSPTTITFKIGSPMPNTMRILYDNGESVSLNIQEGWNTYTIPFSNKLMFSCNSLNIPSDDNRDLGFMFDVFFNGNFENQDTLYTIKNLKSNWIDIVYYLHSSTNGTLTIISENRKDNIPTFTGGQRSISYKINESDINNNSFTFKLNSNSSDLNIVSVINRRDYYDFYGLESSDVENDTSFNLNKSISQINKLKLSLQWFITWKCNMSCEYCWQESASDVYRNLGGKNIITKELWANSINKLNISKLYFTGGEPTLFSDLPYMLELLNNDIRFDMTSNFGKTFKLDDWKGVNSDRWDSMYFSLHPTQWNSPDDFFNKLEQFIQYFDSSKIGIEMVLHPKNVELVSQDRINEFSTKHGLISPHLDEFHNSKFESINRSSNEVSTDINISKDFDTEYKFYEPSDNINLSPVYCAAGWKKLNMDFEGNIYTCMSAIDRSKLFDSSAMPHYSPLGNIFDPNFKVNTRPIICGEAFRCSACDSQVLNPSWNNIKTRTNYRLPIPE